MLEKKNDFCWMHFELISFHVLYFKANIGNLKSNFDYAQLLSLV